MLYDVNKQYLIVARGAASLNAPFGARCFMTMITGLVGTVFDTDVLMHRLALGAL